MTKSTMPDDAGYRRILGEIKWWLRPPAAEKGRRLHTMFVDGSGS
jgi:hypothetical protein